MHVSRTSCSGLVGDILERTVRFQRRTGLVASLLYTRSCSSRVCWFF